MHILAPKFKLFASKTSGSIFLPKKSRNKKEFLLRGLSDWANGMLSRTLILTVRS